MDALSGVGGQWAYGAYPGVSGSRQQPNASAGAEGVVSATAATSSGPTTGPGALAAVIAANASAQSSAQFMNTPGYSDIMSALASQATFSRQALGGNLDLQM
jgi:hypothetical protein